MESAVPWQDMRRPRWSAEVPHEEGSNVVETEPRWRSVVHRGHVPPLSASGTFGREATAVQQFLEIQIASPDTVDVSVSVAVEQEQLALGTGNDNDKCCMQIPAVAPRNQLIRRPVADLKRWRVATDVHHRARRAREFLEFLGRTSEKPVQPRGRCDPWDRGSRRRRCGRSHVRGPVRLRNSTDGDVAANIALARKRVLITKKTHQSGEMATSRSAPESERIRVQPELRTVSAQVSDRCPDIEQLGGKRCLMTQSVLDARDRDAPGDERFPSFRHLLAISLKESASVDPDDHGVWSCRPRRNEQVEL